MASLKNAEATGGRFNIVAFCEARQANEGGGMIVGDGRIPYRHPASANDKGAGLEIHVDPALPPPTEILNPLLVKRGRQDLCTKFQGRFVVYQFNLQDHILLMAVFYGIATGGKVAGALLDEAHRALREIYLLTCKAHLRQEVIVIMLGDFNAYPFWANNLMYLGKNTPTKSSKGLTNRKAMTNLLPRLCPDPRLPRPTVQDGLVFSHAIAFTRPGNPTLPLTYLTNKTVSRSGLTYTGIDHILISHQHGAKYLRNFRNSPTNPGIGIASPSTHNLLEFSLVGIWDRPLRGDRPKSTYKILPSFVFRDEDCLQEIANLINEVADEAEKTQSQETWLQLYDTLVTRKLPTITSRYEEQFRSKYRDHLSALLMEMDTLREANPGALPSARLLAIQREVKEMQKILRQEKQLCAKHIASVKQALDEVDDDVNSEEVDSAQFTDAQENSDNQAKIIPGLISGSRILTSAKCISEGYGNHFAKHFSDAGKNNGLHQRDRRNLKVFLDSLPHITPEETTFLESPLTADDISTALKSYSKRLDSSPGLDGIPAICFCTELLMAPWARILAGLSNAIAETGRVPASLVELAIRLVNKPGKSRLSPTGYRPISLLPISFRILAQVWTLRMQPALAKIIGEHQFAYLSGRRMDHASILLSELLRQAALDPESTRGFLSVDFKSAFDSVKHSYLRSVLQAIGLGPRAVRLLMALATQLLARVITNDNLSKPFSVERGLPQGSALSAVLFILCLEPVIRVASHRVREGGGGIDIGLHIRIIILYVCFADDLNVPFSSLPWASMWLNTLRSFQGPSGLECNWEKTTINLVGGSFWTKDAVTGALTPDASSVAFGSALVNTCPWIPRGCIRVAEDIKYLGVLLSVKGLLGPNGSLTHQCWVLKADALGKRTQHLRRKVRLLSFSKRANLALVYCLSSLLFLAQVSVCPNEIATQIQKHLNMLVFNCGTPPALLRFTSLLPGDSGFGHVNARLRFRAVAAAWLPQYLSGRLPDAVDALFTDGLRSFLVNTKLDVCLSNVHLTRNALVDACITVSRSHEVGSDADNAHLLTGSDSGRKCSLCLAPVLVLAVRAAGAMGVRRFWTPAGTDTDRDNLLRDALAEPIIASSLLNVGDSSNPRGERLHNRASNVLWQLGLSRLSDIIDDNGSCAPWTEDRLGCCTSRKCYSQWCPVVPQGSKADALIPRPTNEVLCNDTWSSVIPQALSLLISQRRAEGLGPLQCLPRVLDWTQPGKVVPSLLPLCVPVYTPWSLSPASESLRMVALESASTKIIYSALISSAFREYIPHPENATPTVFQDGKGWDKLTGGTHPFEDWKPLCTRIGQGTGIPEHLRFEVLSVFFNRLSCRPAVALHLPPISAVSSWSTCPQCDGELSPAHYLIGCPGMREFWVHVLRVTRALVPSLEVPPVHLLMASHVCTAGLGLLAQDLRGGDKGSLTAIIFGHAYRAIRMVRNRPDQLRTARPTPQDLLVLLWNPFLEGIMKYFAGQMGLSLPLKVLRSPLDLPSRVPAIIVYDGVTSRITFKAGTAMGRRSLAKAANPPDEVVLSVVSRLYPYVRFDAEDQIALSPPSHVWPLGPAPDGSWPPLVLDNVGRTKAHTVVEPLMPLLSGLTLAQGRGTTRNVTRHPRPRAPPPPPLGSLGGSLPPNAELFHLATDGAAHGNGSVGVTAAYAAIFPSRPDLNIAERLPKLCPASNNAGELMGAIRGLTIAAREAPIATPVLYTDSTMLIMGVLRHASRWRAGPGGSAATPTILQTPPLPPLGESRQLAPLMRDLGSALRGRTTVICHVASHTGNVDFASYYNDLADKAASAALGPKPPPHLG